MKQLRLEDGRVTLPATVRQSLGLKDGDELLLTLEGDRLILQSEAALLNQLYSAVGSPVTSRLLSDELIQERREAAKQE
jgi:AbrB family looped-hinge helix DNA binding protein